MYEMGLVVLFADFLVTLFIKRQQTCIFSRFVLQNNKCSIYCDFEEINIISER